MPDASERNATVLQAARSRAGGITSDMCVVQSEQGSRPNPFTAPRATIGTA